MNHVLKRKKSFTLIELLVVIGIIGILAAILLPVIAATKYNSQKVAEKEKADKIAVAVERYLSEYGKLPKNDDGQDSNDVVVDATLLNILKGNNTRKINFFPSKSSIKNVWEGNFYISMDGDYDNQISAEGESVTGSVVVYTKYNSDRMSSWETP